MLGEADSPQSYRKNVDGKSPITIANNVRCFWNATHPYKREAKTRCCSHISITVPRTNKEE